MGYLEAKNKIRRVATHLARRIKGEPRIIASLTSYPPRIGTVDKAIRSLLAQKTLPDKIVLYLYEGDFPRGERDLPPQLRELFANDVVVRWVDEDLKSHKKWYWAFGDYPDDLVVLFDDDLIYRNTLIGELLDCHKRFPECVCASRTHFIIFGENGLFLPYGKWEMEAPARYPELTFAPSVQLFATTGAGTLFPPRSLPDEAFDRGAIRELCMNADDVWINELLRSCGGKVVAATENQALEYIPDTQEVALCHENLDSGGNDGYFRQIADSMHGGEMGLFCLGYKDPSFDALNEKLLNRSRDGK